MALGTVPVTVATEPAMTSLGRREAMGHSGLSRRMGTEA